MFNPERVLPMVVVKAAESQVKLGMEEVNFSTFLKADNAFKSLFDE